MRIISSFLFFLLIAMSAIAYFSFYTVHQTQRAMVLQLGAVKKQVDEPGLYFKIPFVQNIVYFDKRLLEVDTDKREIFLKGKKRISVDAFTRYRITNPLKFYQTIGGQALFRSRLSDIVNSSLRQVLSKHSLDDVVRDKRRELMQRVTNIVNSQALEFGAEVSDVRLKRADLPKEVSDNIFKRMRTERNQEAASFRAQGEEKSRTIRAQADRSVVELKAVATQKSEILRGEGDAERNKVFANAFKRDPQFFSFYRAMQAYETGLSAGDTRLVISPKSDFFKYFNSSSGRNE